MWKADSSEGKSADHVDGLNFCHLLRVEWVSPPPFFFLSFFCFAQNNLREEIVWLRFWIPQQLIFERQAVWMAWWCALKMLVAAHVLWTLLCPELRNSDTSKVWVRTLWWEVVFFPYPKPIEVLWLTYLEVTPSELSGTCIQVNMQRI